MSEEWLIQWLERPNYNSAGRELDSHQELGIFCEVLVLEFRVFKVIHIIWQYHL